MVLRNRILMTMALAMTASFAFATSDNNLQGGPIYVKGDAPPCAGSFQPTSGAPDQMFDDGTNGDVTSNDNIYTRAYTGLTPALGFQYKVATNGWSPVNAPDGTDNKYTFVPASGNVNIFIRVAPFADGFSPDAGAGVFADGYVYDDALATYVASPAVTSIKATGAFQSELGGTDYNAATAGAVVLTDAGNTTLGDNIYAGATTGIPAGSYEFKVVLNESFSPAAFGLVGFAGGGGNLSFAVIASTDNLTFTLDANTGRVKVTNDNPLASAGPPFFAQSTAWSTAYDSSTQLYDDGTNGDATGGDNIYSRTFTVAAAGAHTVRVRQGIGRPFPDSGDYPFETLTASQSILVVLDRNVYGDGYSPNTDFVVVLGNSPRIGLNKWERVAPVGQLATAFGGGDWSADSVSVNLFDDGTNGDSVANDQIWTRAFAEFGTVSNQQIKGVANFKGAGLTGYTNQLGGTTDGITTSGNNASALFSADATGNTTVAIDAVTGRLLVGASGYVAPANRSAVYFSGFTEVNDWTMY